MKFVDSHAHYNDLRFEEEFPGGADAAISASHDAGAAYILNAGTNMQTSLESIALSQKFPFVFAAAGIHPYDCTFIEESVDSAIAEIEPLLSDPAVRAIGEIGLDYYWDKESHELQKEWFKKQMELAKEVDLPVIVHSREAAQDTFDLIKSEHAGTTGGVIHCFSGSKEMAKEYIKMGYYIGVGGVVTFKNARVLKEVVESIPLERILTETDCPYLAPVPFRGKRNCSAYISYVLDMIAELKGISREEAEQVTYENARNMYRITD